MNFSDIVVDCSKKCAALAVRCTDPQLAEDLRALAVRLLSAAHADAELSDTADIDEVHEHRVAL